MKNCRKLSLILCCILMVCVFAFAGCASLRVGDYYFKPYVGSETENEKITLNTEGLSLQEKKTKIAEEYIKISFTVIIAKKVDTVVYTSAGVEKSKDTKETFSSFGSGTIIHKGGYILTNYHVIQTALTEPSVVNQTNAATREITKITTSYVVYVSQDGGETVYDATILWSGYNFDLAVIVCEQFAELKAAPLKDRSVYCSQEDKINVLEDIITVGTQYNQENYGSATTGTISSNIVRSVYGSDLNLNYEYLIQHDAAINHGNSGGALIDMNGNLIGVNTLGVDNANSLFYAVSVYPVISILPTIVKNWENKAQATTDVVVGFSGIDKLMVRNAPTGAVADQYLDFNKSGVIVIGVNADCIVSGLKVNDIIKEIRFTNGTTSETFKINCTYDFLYARLRMHDYKTATFVVERDGTNVELTLNQG